MFSDSRRNMSYPIFKKFIGLIDALDLVYNALHFLPNPDKPDTLLPVYHKMVVSEFPDGTIASMTVESYLAYQRQEIVGDIRGYKLVDSMAMYKQASEFWFHSAARRTGDKTSVIHYPNPMNIGKDKGLQVMEPGELFYIKERLGEPDPIMMTHLSHAALQIAGPVSPSLGISVSDMEQLNAAPEGATVYLGTDLQ